MWTIAIGDIHGHADKLSALLRAVDRWAVEVGGDQNRQLVFLGDYIDRGPDSREVLAIVRQSQANGSVCLRGNHEDLMIRSTHSELDRQSFLINGGVETCRSLASAEAFAEARAWMETLPLSFEDELRFYVHAGVRPGVPLAEQSTKDQMWIREVFLAHKNAFAKYIVHGHTPIKPRANLPEVLANRCNLDTGAAYRGPLSAAVFSKLRKTPAYLINSEGEIVAFSESGPCSV